MLIAALYPGIIAIGGNRERNFLSVHYPRPISESEKKKIPLTIESVMKNRRFPVKVQIGYDEFIFTPGKATSDLPRSTLENHYRALLKAIDIRINRFTWDAALQPFEKRNPEYPHHVRRVYIRRRHGRKKGHPFRLVIEMSKHIPSRELIRLYNSIPSTLNKEVEGNDLIVCPVDWGVLATAEAALKWYPPLLLEIGLEDSVNKLEVI